MLGKIISMLFWTLGDFIKEGKIKHIGLSNAWNHAFSGRKHHHLPRIKTVQIHILC
jgi:aryl-alcohol dehydrogenase-like predicted oxidoreductase